MKTFLKSGAAALALAGAALFGAGSANAGVDFNVSIGVPGAVGLDYDSGGYCDDAGCPDQYWDYPVYYGPVFYAGNWFNGPVYYRDFGGARWFWVRGGWHRDEWRGRHPNWWRDNYRYGPALGYQFYLGHGFRHDRDRYWRGNDWRAGRSWDRSWWDHHGHDARDNRDHDHDNHDRDGHDHDNDHRDDHSWGDQWRSGGDHHDDGHHDDGHHDHDHDHDNGAVNGGNNNAGNNNAGGDDHHDHHDHDSNGGSNGSNNGGSNSGGSNNGGTNTGTNSGGGDHQHDHTNAGGSNSGGDKDKKDKHKHDHDNDNDDNGGNH